MEENKNQSRLCELLARIYCDSLPESVDLVYLHGQTKDFQNSVLDSAAEFYHEGFARRIGITSLDSSELENLFRRFDIEKPELSEKARKNLKVYEDGAVCGYPGSKKWKAELEQRGVKPEHIVLIEPRLEEYPLTTGSEAHGLVKFVSQNKEYNAICITASQIHQPRVFLTEITAMIQQNVFFPIYSRLARAQDWNEEAVHSQGTQRGKMKDLLLAELEKIEKYQKIGNPPWIESYEKIIDCLDRIRTGKVS